VELMMAGATQAGTHRSGGAPRHAVGRPSHEGAASAPPPLRHCVASRCRGGGALMTVVPADLRPYATAWRPGAGAEVRS
jgi:hypothetical protein